MLVVGLAAAFALAAPTAYAQMSPQGGAQTQAKPNAGAKMNKADERFLTEAIQGDLAEVKMGELAQQKGGTDRVKEFGQTLAKDHGDHAKTLQQLGQQVGIATLPSEPSAKQKAEHDRLGKLSGAQFDREFAKLVVDDHRKDIAKYQAEAKKSGPIGTMAKQTIPTLQQHLQMAQELTRPAPTTGSGGMRDNNMRGSSGGGMSR
jgi:putative membrane protein